MKITYASPYIVKTSDCAEDLVALAEDVIKHELHIKPNASMLLYDMERLLLTAFKAKLKTNLKAALPYKPLKRVGTYRWIRNKVKHQRQNEIISIIYSPHADNKPIAVLHVRAFMTAFFVNK